MTHVLRAALYTLVGVLFCAYWVIADPGYDESATQDDWAYVLGFSAAILSLSFALPSFARLVGGRVAFRVGSSRLAAPR